MTVNTKGSFRDWLESKVALMPSVNNYSATVLGEGEKIVYPSVTIDYIDEGVISFNRGQYYDLLTLHVKVDDPANNDFMAEMIKKYLDSLWGISEGSLPMNPVVIIPLQDIEGILLGTVAASPCPQIGEIEVRARNSGWSERGNENLRHYSREIQNFY